MKKVSTGKHTYEVIREWPKMPKRTRKQCLFPVATVLNGKRVVRA